MMMKDYLKSLNKALSTKEWRHTEQLFSIAGSIIWINYVSLGNVKGSTHGNAWWVAAPAHKDSSSTPLKHQPAGKQGEQSSSEASPVLLLP